MKNKIVISIVALLALWMIGCNDAFLDRYPETSITEVNFFKSAGDLELYSNQFYDYFMYFGTGFFTNTPSDYPSDNVDRKSVV